MIIHQIMVLIFLVCITWGNLFGESSAWTWMYKICFTPEEQKINSTKKNINFIATDIPYFTQCIFSWNAFRPDNGYFSFYAQVRNAKTKQWDVWHKMFDWGAGVQRSHITLAEGGTSYHHVRLEVPTAFPADAIRIRIEPYDGASLSNVYGLYASVSRLDKFVPENASQFFNLPSVHIKGIPLLSQKVLDHPRKDGLCSPTSLSMVISFLGNKKVDPCLFANNVYDAGLDGYGSWPFNIVHAFEHLEGRYCLYVGRLSSFAMVYQMLRNKIPIVVSVRGMLSGGAKEYSQGHLLVVTGWHRETKSVLCHDPAFDNNGKVAISYSLKDFLKAWECSRRLAYIAEPIS